MKSITRLLTAATLALSGLFAAEAYAQSRVELSFIRVGTTVDDVAIILQDENGAVIPGAHATLTVQADGTDVSLQPTQNDVNCGIVCPNENKNTGKKITIQLDITGLPTEFSYDVVQLEARALDLNGNYQEGNDKRWNFTMQQGATSTDLGDFSTLSDEDLGSNIGAPRMVNFAGNTITVGDAGTQSLKLVGSNVTGGGGCYIGLSRVVLYDSSKSSAAEVGEQDDDATIFQVDLSNGEGSDFNGGNTLFNTWTANATDPGLTLSDGSRDIGLADETHLDLYSVANRSYTLTTSSTHYISAYYIEFVNSGSTIGTSTTDGPNMTITPAEGGPAVTCEGTATAYASAAGLSSNSASFSVASATNATASLTATKFLVKVKSVRVVPTDGQCYRLRNVGRTNRYMSAGSSKLTSTTASSSNADQIFILQASDSYWHIYNPITESYVGKTGEIYAETQLVELESAGLFTINMLEPENGRITLKCENGGPASYPAYRYLHLDGNMTAVVPWEASSEASQWYIEPVDEAAAAAILSLSLLQEAKEAYDTYAYFDLATSASNYSTNAQEESEGPISNLFDYNVGTMFHTAWTASLKDGNSGKHFVQFAFDEPQTKVVLKYSKRESNHRNAPTNVTILVPATGEGTALTDTWSTELYTDALSYAYSTLYPSAGLVAESSGELTINSETPFSHLRFLVNNTQTNEKNSHDQSGPLWSLSELHAYKANPLNAQEETDDNLAEQISTVDAAVTAGNATMAQYEALRAALNAFLAAYTGEFSITTAKYATYYTDKAFIMPAGVKGAYINPVLSQSGEGTTDDPTVYTVQINWDYEAGSVVPAGTPLLVNATDDLTETTTFMVKKTASEEVAPSPNLLHGQLEAGQTTLSDDPDGSLYWYYALYQTPDGKIGFWWSNNDGTPYELGANKAFLAIKKSDAGDATIKGLTIDPVGDITAITAPTLSTQQQSAAIYTLSGVRVNSSTTDGLPAGVYIVGGKKVLVK